MSYLAKQVAKVVLDQPDETVWSGYTFRVYFPDQIHGCCFHKDATRYQVAKALRELAHEILKRPDPT